MENNVVPFPIFKEYDELTGLHYFVDSRLTDFMVTYIDQQNGHSITGTIAATSCADALKRWVKYYPENRHVVKVLKWVDFF